MKFARVVVIGGFVLICLFVIADSLKHPPVSERLRLAREEQQIDNIFFYGAVKHVLSVVAPTVLLLAVIIVAYGIARSRILKASVHTARIGKHSEIPVERRDLRTLSPILTGLVTAEQLRQMNGGMEKAFALYMNMADIQTKQIQALVGRRGIFNIPASRQHQEEIPALPPSQHIPTFRELLDTQEIAPGKPMILGFAHGVPRRGSFLDIYSSAVAGESGSGKTATLLYLIASGLIAGPVRYIGIDPHYPHPKSLGFKTKALWDAGLIRMATYKDEMLTVLTDIEQTIDRRLQQIETDTTPVVLVIDELAFLSKTSIGNTMAHTMERISTEGRKCAVYMLASSQTWLVARTGQSSVVRDTLTSAFVHRIKPKQANLLLQDKEEVNKVKKYVRQAGEVLLCPVNDESVICKIPLTTDADMERVVARVAASGQRVDQPVAPGNRSVDLIDQAQKYLNESGTTLRQLAENAGVDKGYLSRVLHHKKPLSESLKQKLSEVIS